MKTMYPPEYVQKITMDAFEVVMKELRAHKDERVKELAQTADACFLTGIGVCLAILLLVAWLWWAAGEAEVQE